MADTQPTQHRCLLCYKGDISALILFARQSNGSICFPEPLPKLSVLAEVNPTDDSKLSLHPSLLLPPILTLLKLPENIVKIEAGFLEQIETANGLINLHLARFTLLDPPHQLLQAQNCQLLPLTALRQQSELEMQLLRRAYSFMMES